MLSTLRHSFKKPAVQAAARLGLTGATLYLGPKAVFFVAGPSMRETSQKLEKLRLKLKWKASLWNGTPTEASLNKNAIPFVMDAAWWVIVYLFLSMQALPKLQIQQKGYFHTFGRQCRWYPEFLPPPASSVFPLFLM